MFMCSIIHPMFVCGKKWDGVDWLVHGWRLTSLPLATVIAEISMQENSREMGLN